MGLSGLLALDDAEFWSSPFKTRDETQRRLSREGFVGVAIDAPQSVPLDGRQTIPVVGWHVTPLREARALSFEDFAVVTAVSEGDGFVYAKRLYDPRTQPSTRPPLDDDDHDPGEGRAYRAFRFDLNERVGIGLRPDTCRIMLLVQDQRSNRVTTTLRPPTLRWVDPEVQRYVAQARGVDPATFERFPEPVSPAPGAPLPSYQPSAETPEREAGEGLWLAGPASVARGTRCPIHGSFRLPVPEELRVRERPDDPEWTVGDPSAAAVLPVTLVLTGSRVPGPYVVRLQVPVYGPLGDGPGEGQFALDLNAALPGLGPQRYFVYAFSGAAVGGPVAVELS